MSVEKPTVREMDDEISEAISRSERHAASSTTQLTKERAIFIAGMRATEEAMHSMTRYGMRQINLSRSCGDMRDAIGELESKLGVRR